MRNVKFMILSGLAAFSVGCYKKAPIKSEAGVIIGADDSLEISLDDTSVPSFVKNLYPAIGAIRPNCTAFHIGNGVAVTAGHCFSNGPSADSLIACNATLIEWGVVDPKPPVSKSRCVALLYRVFDEDADIAVMKIAPSPDVSMQIAAREEQEDLGEVGILGYPQHHSLTWSNSCPIKREDSDLTGREQFTHFCDTGAGNSGSPVLNPLSGNVIGIHNGGLDRQNYATFFRQKFIDEIQRKLQILEAISVRTFEELTFGPFAGNELRILALLTSPEKGAAAFNVKFDLEEPDTLKIVDGKGRFSELTGTGSKDFRDQEFPVVVSFNSGYGGKSKSIVVRKL
jgi:hypothetical protein